MAGAFVAFEGIDQAGKMTLAGGLQRRLQASGLACEVHHYPDYDTAIGGLIRAFLSRGLRLDAHARCMLFAANRWEKDAAVRAIVAASDLVCIDRYTWSNVVYGLSQGLDESWLCGLEDGLLEPDLTVLIDIPPEESQRRKARERDDYERDMRLLENARAHYRRIARVRDWCVVDGTGERDAVAARLHAALAVRLGPRWPALGRALGG